MKVGYEQIFVGREGTGSPFHHAAVYNMFYMVDGKKTWWFIDPYDSFLAYPMAVLGKAAGALLCLWPNEYNKEVGILLIIFFHSFLLLPLLLFLPWLGVPYVSVLPSVYYYSQPWGRALQPTMVVAQHQGLVHPITFLFFNMKFIHKFLFVEIMILHIAYTVLNSL